MFNCGKPAAHSAPEPKLLDSGAGSAPAGGAAVRRVHVKDTEFEIYHGDTLTNDWDILRELNPAKKPSFDAVLANPPFSYLRPSRPEQNSPARPQHHTNRPADEAEWGHLILKWTK